MEYGNKRTKKKILLILNILLILSYWNTVQS